ncbi:MAG: hypothetical protein GC201_01190 [Alphaproteobacteria bacterium]|nr:hypothetical protein [Alphaproteobacteria bacterium]
MSKISPCLWFDGKAEEAARFYVSLLPDGGTPVQCGWLADRYGVSWQIVPRRLAEIMAHPDAGRVRRTTGAMLRQVKIDTAEIEQAFNAT